MNINETINTTTIRINGEAMKISDGLIRAQELDLDLIQIGESQGQAICIIDDLSKYLYDQKKKQKGLKQKAPALKEIKFGFNTSDNDILHKCNRIREFLNDNHKVKLCMVLRGRELAFKRIASDKLNKIVESLSDFSKTDGPIQLEGKSFQIILTKK